MTMYRRPNPLTRLMNRGVLLLAGSGLAPSRMVVLEVRGRRSGQVRPAVVNLVEVGGQRYLVSPRGEAEWVRNLRAAGGEAAIRHGRRQSVRLEELPPGERAPVLQAYLRENAWSTRQHFGISPNAPIEEFERVGSLHPVFRIVTL